MSYVIRKLGTSEYVSRAGSWHSYTRKIEDARKFGTYEEAHRARCIENEVIEEGRWPSDH